MIQRFGAERFLDAKLVRADKADFPDPWEGTLHSVHQVLYRLCWHAYIDFEVVVEDQRPLVEGTALLRTSEIEIASCTAGVVTFHLTNIGNDDVAGMLAHKVGEAFLDLAPGEPFRSTPRVPDEREASVAAVFLGLGVPAANATMYRRHATEIIGREERSEQLIAHVGGLDIAEVTLLLAVQDILRDEVQGALSTLHGPQREWVEDWKVELDPHEEELRVLLGVDTRGEPRPLSRGAAPRRAPAYDEGTRKRFNVGEETMRVVRRSYLGLAGGAILGLLLASIGSQVVDAPPELALIAVGCGLLVGLVVGYRRWCRPYYRCAEAACSGLVGANDPHCRHCGGTITRTVTQLELEALWAQWRAEEDERDEQLDPSEFAGDPDAGEFREEYAMRKRRASRRERGA
ncbi:MAG: hypothetical protein ACKV2T_01710 [Kofleriaceae bacterium]